MCKSNKSVKLYTEVFHLNTNGFYNGQFLYLQINVSKLVCANIFCLECLSKICAKTIHAKLIAISQLEGSTPAIAIPQLLKKCCSATAILQLQFFLQSATSSPQLESFSSAIFSIFLAVESV